MLTDQDVVWQFACLCKCNVMHYLRDAEIWNHLSQHRSLFVFCCLCISLSRHKVCSGDLGGKNKMKICYKWEEHS